MSKVNQRKLTAFHEAAHAIMAWVEGIPIIGVRLVPEDESHALDGETRLKAPQEWTPAHVVSFVRKTLAGPEGEKFGPMATGVRERTHQRDEQLYHDKEAGQYLRQFLEIEMTLEDIVSLVASAKQDVSAVFGHPSVESCLRSLASELMRRGEMKGEDVEQFIAKRITAEERLSIQANCCRTRAR